MHRYDGGKSYEENQRVENDKSVQLFEMEWSEKI